MIVSFYVCVFVTHVFVTQYRRNYKTDLTKIWNGDRSYPPGKILACFYPERIHVSQGVFFICEKLKFATAILTRDFF